MFPRFILFLFLNLISQERGTRRVKTFVQIVDCFSAERGKKRDSERG